jgi:hypothetical protein
MRPVPVTASPPFDGHDLAVESLGRAVGDPIPAKGQDVIPMPGEHLPDLAHRRQACLLHPGQPAFPEPFDPADAEVVPQPGQVFLHGPGLGHLQVRGLQGFQGRSVLVRQVLFPVKPDVLGALEAFVFLMQPFTVLPDEPCPRPDSRAT